MYKRFLLLLVLLSFVLSVQSQVFTESNLPIVIINTDSGASIPDEPGVLGDMKIIYRGPGLINYVTDQDSLQYLDFYGRIDIEIRGSYSQSFPKKAYGFTTVMSDNVTNNNVSLLSMPSENDWVLDGLSSDPSLIRDYLSFNLSRQIGLYASRTAYCEVMINGDYRGLYILEEKVKADKNRVNIVKIDSTDNSQPELSGGYITKTDKTTGGDPIAWYMSSYIGYNDCQFIHSWPKPENITTQQNNYIKSVFLSLQTVCTAGNSSISNGYPSIIDIPSFVDYILVNEIASNVDAYTYSTYYHKDRNGKLWAGPVWDMNLTFGNDLFELGVDRSKPDVWQFSNGSCEGPKYYRDLFNNATFKCYLSRRWNELTQPGRPFNLVSLESFIDTTVSLISDAVVREDARWGTIGNHQASISSLKDWLNLRIPWMTNHLGSYNACQNVYTPPLDISGINYHPGTSIGFPDEDKLEFLEITNAGTSVIDLTGIYFGGMGLVYQFPAGSSLPAGNSLFLAGDIATFQNRYGIAPWGQFIRNLSNADENLLLLDAFGNEIDHVHYYDHLPWPDADGNGKFLQLICDTLDNSLASSWIAVDDNTVGIGFLTIDPLIHVYPNPTTGQVRISAEHLMKTIDITDLQGRVLTTFPVKEKDFSFDISRLPKGIYFIRVISRQEIRFEKIIKD
ncbi:MAG: CotH kinase family protein [Bacteroidetes bacterium]|nr:CotH kinase family protein [Bacteroidota bacterium]